MYNNRKIKKLINSAKIGMFVTQDNGKLFSRPIAFSDVDNDNCIWFFTDINSGKINDIANNQNVNFSFSNQSENTYVSVSGTAELIKDPEIIDEKWSVIVRAWYPEGRDSDRLTLVKVTPSTIQYWDGYSSKIIMAYDITKALVTGRSYVDVANSNNEIIEY